MEFTRLAQLTRENKYYDAIARITNELEIMQNKTRLPGMWPLSVDASGCKPPVKISSHPVRPAAHESAKKPNKASGVEVAKPAKPSPASTLEKSLPIPKEMEKRDAGLEVESQPEEYKSQTKSPDPSTSYLDPEKECEKQGLASPNNKYDSFGLGGRSDSTYEYLPKEHMLLGGVIDQYRRLYEISMKPVREKLIFRPMLPEPRDIRFVATVKLYDSPAAAEADDAKEWASYTYEGTHLTCFAGGMFAVGAKLFGLEDDMDIAAKLTDGCVWGYESTTTGIMAEGFEVIPCDNPLSCPWNQTKFLDVMDPNESSRIQQAEKSYERQLFRAKETYYHSR